jgi:hypothetical protein
MPLPEESGTRERFRHALILIRHFEQRVLRLDRAESAGERSHFECALPTEISTIFDLARHHLGSWSGDGGDVALSGASEGGTVETSAWCEGGATVMAPYANRATAIAEIAPVIAGSATSPPPPRSFMMIDIARLLAIPE